MTRRFSRTLPAAFGLAALGLAALSVPAGAQSMAEKLPVDQPLRGHPRGPVPDSLRPAGQPVLIPELTEVPVVLKDDLKSGGTKAGSEVLFFVARDVYAPGQLLVIARNTPVIGHIVASPNRGGFGTAGKLFLTCDYVLAQDGTRVPLRAVQQEARGKGSHPQDLIPLGALGFFHTLDDGLIATGAFTLAAGLTEGGDAELHPGRRFLVYVNAPTAVTTPLPAAEVPFPVREPSVAAGPPREALVIMKDGTFVAGLMRTVGNDYLVTNSAGSQRVHARDVHSIEYASDAGYPSSDNR